MYLFLLFYYFIEVILLFIYVYWVNFVMEPKCQDLAKYESIILKTSFYIFGYLLEHCLEI